MTKTETQNNALPALPSLREKLYKIYEAVDHIEKLGHNKAQNYKYIRSADVIHAIRKQLTEQRVYAEINFDFVGEAYTVARAKDKDAPFTAVNVRCRIRFVDLDSDEVLTSSGLGTGADTGDKAAYKAQTGALKYAIKNAFLVPDEADPEADERIDEQPDFRETRRVANVPEFQDDPKGQAAPYSETNSAKSAAAPLTKTETAPAAAREPGDESEDTTMPTEEEMKDFIAQFKRLSDELTTDGKLKASKGLPVNVKVKIFLCNIGGVDNPKDLTKSQWVKFFDRVAAGKANPEVGLVGIAKLVNKANGIVEDAK